MNGDPDFELVEVIEADARSAERSPIDDDLARLLTRFDGHEPMTTKEVRRETDLGYRAVLDRLERLHERGILDRKEVPDGAVVWWRA